MIFSVEHISEIIQKEKDLQEKFLKNDYILDCYKVVNLDLVGYFGDHYLLHKAYFIDDNGPVHPLTFNDVLDKQNRISINNIAYAESAATKKGTVPFTKIILRKHIQGLVLFNGKNPDNVHGMISQDLKDKDRLKQLASKLDVKMNQISLLLKKYKMHSDEIGRQESFYAYFIRPFAHHQLYNGVFLILLKRSLNKEEFLELGNLWTKVLSETAIVEIAKFTQAKEQELIFEEQIHTWNTEIASIVPHLDIASKHLGINEKGLTQDIFNHVNFALSKTQLLRTVTAFNLFLMKSRDIESWEKISDVKCHALDKELINSLRPRAVKIKEVLLEAHKTLTTVVQSYADFDKKATPSYLKALEILGLEIIEFPECTAHLIPVSLYIVVLDLLKNALLHSNWEKIEMNVGIVKHKKCIELQFSNNTILPKEVFQYINDEKYSDTNRRSRKGGLRTIKRIINSSLLNNSNESWKLQATEASLRDKTTIMLLIPISNSNEEIR